MNETKKAVVKTLLIISCLINLAAADPVINVSPQPTEVTLNEMFTAEVTVDPVDGEIYAISYDLHFNPDILKATEQIQGDFLSRDGTETFVVVNKIDNAIGKVAYGESRTGGNGVTTPGTLSSITFTVIGDGISDLTLDNVLFDDLANPTPTTPPPISTPTPEPTDDGGTSSHGPSGSSAFTAAPTATITEAPMASEQASADDDGDVVEDRSADEVASGKEDHAAESMSTAAPAKKTPAHPSSKSMPGFAAISTIIWSLIVIYIIKLRR